MTIAVDFDGTIVEHMYPEIGALKKYADVVINEWMNEGHEVIIWTCREGKCLDDMIMFLDLYDINYTSINENIHLPFETSNKIYADVYIDDRQLGGIPNDWRAIRTILKNCHGNINR